METASSIWQHLGRLLAISCLVYFVGHVTMAFVRQRENVYRDLFFKMIFGSILLVSAYATARCGGRSVLAGVWIIFGFAGWLAVRRGLAKMSYVGDNIFRIHTPSIAAYLVYTTIVFAAFYAQMTCGTSGIYGALFEDFSFYGAIADRLVQTGYENTAIGSPWYYVEAAPSFYHYFELWFAGAVGWLFAMPSSITLFLVVHPILLGAACCGARAIAGRYRIGKPLAFALSLSILFLTAYRWPLSTGLSRPFFLMAGSKLSIVLALSVWFFLQDKAASLSMRLLPLALLCVLYPPVAPVLISALIITVAVIAWRGKRPLNEILAAVTLTLVPALWLIAFYRFNRQSAGGDASGFGLLDYLSMQEGGDFLKQVLIKWCKKFYFAAYMIPFMLLALSRQVRTLIAKNEWAYTGVILAGMLVAGGLAVSILQGWNYNAGQLLVNLWSPFTLVGCFVMACAFVSNRRPALSAGFVILIYVAGLLLSPWIWTIIGNQGQKRMDMGRESAEVAALLGPRQPRVAFMMTGFGEDVPDLTLTVRIPFAAVRLYRTDYYPVCLSIFELPDKKDMAGRRVVHTLQTKSLYGRYCKARFLDGKSDVTKCAFLVEFAIEFLICEDDDKWVENMNIPIKSRKDFPCGKWTVYQIDCEAFMLVGTGRTG